jgi:2,4-dienoyl-CoA reductase-like NADH-dependent reductase (Old Yellow Enzyme family)
LTPLPKPDLFAPLPFARGPAMKNRFMLAPLTNTQSHPDGRLSDEEFHWLEMRAKGGFGLTMTCAAHVQAIGQGFPGQLGIFSGIHLDGLTRLATAIRAAGSRSSVQLHHAGMRSPADLISETPVCPSDNEVWKSRALTLAEVEQLAEDFIAAAVRADRAGFDGVEVHGAHGYVLCEFLSEKVNLRKDRYGGSPENRGRLIEEIIAGIRARCRPDFTLGLRLSPERFDVDLPEIAAFAQKILRAGHIDYLDMSLWDFRKEPGNPAYKGRTLMSYFTELDRCGVPLGVAGKIMSAADAREALAAGADFVLLGKGAMLHHDFPNMTKTNPDFQSVALPVSRDYLAKEGLSPAFLDYVKRFDNFLIPEEVVERAQ